MRRSWRERARDPMSWVLPVLLAVGIWCSDLVRGFGLAWYWEALAFVGVFAVATMLCALPFVLYEMYRDGGMRENP